MINVDDIKFNNKRVRTAKKSFPKYSKNPNNTRFCHKVDQFYIFADLLLIIRYFKSIVIMLTSSYREVFDNGKLQYLRLGETNLTGDIVDLNLAVGLDDSGKIKV